MGVTIPREYLVTVGETNFMAEYVGSGRDFMYRWGFHPDQATEQFPVPEGTLMVAEPGACQLFTGDADGLYDLSSEQYHFYRLQRLE